MRFVRTVALAVVVAALAAACSGGVSTVGEPGAQDSGSPTTPPSLSADDDAAATDDAEASPGSGDDDAGEQEDLGPSAGAVADSNLADTQGLIATTGERGLRLVTATGAVEALLFGDDRVSQPTWSRDGARLAATHEAVGSRTISVLTTTAADPEAAALARADRPYFFYSWNHQGTRIAALGPGPRGTSLDVLDGSGAVVSNAPIEAGSVFVSWEPDGDGMLLNVDGELRVVDDATDLTASRSLGPAGVPFQAPVWTGDGEALAVLPRPEGLIVARVGVDDGAVQDLGPATGGTFIVLSPDASMAVLVHGADAAEGDIVSASFQLEPATEISGPVELLDLSTGERRRISGDSAFWAEWSPDGSTLLLGAASEGSLRWDVWKDGRLTSLTPFVPSQEFFASYIRFAPAYLESPRLWAPDGGAITYGAIVDGADAARAVSLAAGSVPATVAASSVAFWAPAAPS